MKLDNLHYNFTKIDGFNKPFNFIISEREAGKSTALWVKIYRKWKNEGKPSIVLRRLIADVTETYIQDIETVLNKFLDVPIEIAFKKGDLKSGIVDVYISELDPKGYSDPKKCTKLNKRLFFRVIGLSNDLTRLKSMLMPKMRYILFDEFICNERHGEKYLKEETFQFKELYNTFNRETEHGIISYFIGNPYSVYNPYFTWWGIDTRRIKPGAYFSTDICTLECYKMKPELRAKILEKNPLYQFDDSYRAYAFDGTAINDINIKLIKKPNGACLKYIFKINNSYIGFYMIPQQDEEYVKDNLIYYCETLKAWKDSYNREAVIFDLNDQSKNTNMLMLDRSKYTFLKLCIGNGRVGYDKVDSENATEFIYDNV